MWARTVSSQLRLVEAVVCSDTASDDGVHPLVLDGVLFDGLEVDVHARFFEDVGVLLEEGGRP